MKSNVGCVRDRLACELRRQIRPVNLDDDGANHDVGFVPTHSSETNQLCGDRRNNHIDSAE